MSSISQVLSSTEQFKQAFEDGLTGILQTRTAGTFILGCANIFQHPELIVKHIRPLREVYAYIKEYYRNCKDNNLQPDDSIDDILVMKQIIAIGFDNLEPLQYRLLDSDNVSYQIGYNQLRSFRPARMSKVKDICLNTCFNSKAFHFDKIFLKKEMFAEGEYHGRQVSLLYNKFPFVEYHALLIVDKVKHINQFLTKEYLKYVAHLQTSIHETTPDLIITYNSIGAGASVNHLHFQVFLESHAFALFSDKLVHNGGTVPYPAACCVFTDADGAWSHIHKLHTENVPYNLLFKDKKIYCLAGKPADKEFPEINISTYGWSDMAGVFNLNDKEVFKNISADRLIETIKAVTDHTVKCHT